MKTFFEENWFKFGIIIGLFFIGWVMFQSLVVLPREKEERILTEKQLAIQQTETLKQAQQNNLNECLYEAEQKKNSSVEYWNDYSIKTCDVPGLSISSQNYCLDGVLKSMNEAKVEERKDRDECYKKYPQN